jgi:hypothetical protein
MIITSQGKQIAFGMRWEVIIGGQTPKKKAIEIDSQLYWADPEGQYVGGLPSGDVLPKKRPIFSAAQALLRADKGGGSKHVLAIVALPDAPDNYVVIGIHGGRPRRGWDRGKVAAGELGTVLERFMEVCGNEDFVLAGDAPLQGIVPLSLADLADAADHKCQLRKVPGRINAVKTALIIVIIGSVAYGIQTFLNYRAHQRLVAAARTVKSPATQYREAIATAGAAPIVKVTDLDDWYSWMTQMPRQVGGWYFKSAGCSFSATTKKLSCSLGFVRSAFALATNQTFFDAKPHDWPADSVAFDAAGKAILVTLERPIHTEPTRTILDALPTRGQVRLSFDSLLQTLQRVATGSAGSASGYGSFKVFALPPDLSPDQIPSPVFSARWSFAGPARDIAAIRQFPPYLSVERMTFNYDEGAASGLNSSIASIAVSGQLFTR